VSQVEVLIIRQGDPLYEPVFGGLRRDQALLDRMWREAESRLDERPDKVWVVAVDGGRALAWCAYQPEAGGRVKAVNSFERPECWDADWYGVVYAVRHELIRRCEATTFVFNEILPLHVWDGWVPFVDGMSDEPGVPSHHWTGLRRAADARS